MDLELVEVLWKYGKFPASKLPVIASKVLMNGGYGIATAEIAGMVEPDEETIGNLFERSILEVQKKFLDEHDSAFVLARGIVEREVEPFEGLTIMAILFETLGQPSELILFAYLLEEYSEYLPPKYNPYLKENKLIPVFKRSCDKDIIRAASELLKLKDKKIYSL
jgi:hypothetical protein